MIRRPPKSPLFPHPPLSRSGPALVQKKPAQARRYLQRAMEALPDDTQILLTVMSVELSENQPAAATRYLVQALKHADGPVPLDHQTIGYLQYRLHEIGRAHV